MLSVAVAIAHALGISLDELAGEPEQRLQISGNWWAGWQTWKDGAARSTPSSRCGSASAAPTSTSPPTTAASHVDEGGYQWRGELRLWDNEILMGWYAADDQAVRSKGTLYFVVHPHGQQMSRPLGRHELRRTRSRPAGARSPAPRRTPRDLLRTLSDGEQ